MLVGGLDGLLDRLEAPAGVRPPARAVVQFVVGADGGVVCSDVVEGEDRALDEAARRAVHASSFVPGQRAGQPVAVVMGIPVTLRAPGTAP